MVDRRALGAIVFNNPDQRRWLEQLVHPIVRQRFDQELMRLDAMPAVVLMIPLLFESGLEGLCSETWLVDCDESQQLQRLMARDQLSEAEAQARMNAQWPPALKAKLAAWVPSMAKASPAGIGTMDLPSPRNISDQLASRASNEANPFWKLPFKTKIPKQKSERPLAFNPAECRRHGENATGAR